MADMENMENAGAPVITIPESGQTDLRTIAPSAHCTGTKDANIQFVQYSYCPDTCVVIAVLYCICIIIN